MQGPPVGQSLGGDRGSSNLDAWLESVFFRVHTRCAMSVSRVMGVRSRRVFEGVCALIAAGGIGLLVGLHRRYDGPTAVSAALAEARWALEGREPSRRLRAYAVEIVLRSDEDESCAVAGKNYWYSRERGIAELSEAARLELKVPSRRVDIAETDLGPWFWRLAAGSDAIVANAALRAFGNVGRLSVGASGDGYDLSRCEDPAPATSEKKRRRSETKEASSKKRGRQLRAYLPSWRRTVKKATIALKTFFLIFSTSTLSSYTLRETQTRMLRFAYLIKERVSNRESYIPLVTAHLLDSVVFAPITLGMLSFL